MSYPLIVRTLHEFDLITLEQAEQALEEYNREVAEMEERAHAFEKQWNATTPWWKKWFGHGWYIDYLDAEQKR